MNICTYDELGRLKVVDISRLVWSLNDGFEKVCDPVEGIIFGKQELIRGSLRSKQLLLTPSGHDQIRVINRRGVTS